jgi:hypothetical protein
MWGKLKKWAFPVAFGSLALASFGFGASIPTWVQGIAFGIAAISSFV